MDDLNIDGCSNAQSDVEVYMVTLPNKNMILFIFYKT